MLCCHLVARNYYVFVKHALFATFWLKKKKFFVFDGNSFYHPFFSSFFLFSVQKQLLMDDGQNALMKKVLDTYLLFFQINQSTATLRHIFAALRLFVQKVRRKPTNQPTHCKSHTRVAGASFSPLRPPLSAVPQRLLPGQGGPVRLPVPRDPQVLQPPLQLHPDGGVRAALLLHEEKL